jgi:hypothetical protein
MRAFKEFIVGGADGQVKRAASKFGLVAVAGELAIVQEGFGQTRDSARNLRRPAAERTQPAERLFHFCSYVTSRSASVVSTTKIASRLAGSVALAFSLMG